MLDSYYNVYVLNQGSNTVSVINTTTNSVVDTIPVGIHPVSIMASNPYSYVANLGSNTVSVINSTAHKVDSILAGFRPTDIQQVEFGTSAPSIGTSVIPPAAFILSIFERLPQNEYDDILKPLSIAERNELVDNPSTDTIANFLYKLTTTKLADFLNKFTPAELHDLSGTLSKNQFAGLLNKLPMAEHSKLANKL